MIPKKVISQPYSFYSEISRSVVAISIMAVNVVYFIYQCLNGASWLSASPDQLLVSGGNDALLTLTGEIWRLFSSIFIHVGLVHLLINMLMLVPLCQMAERHFGRIQTLVIYLAGGILASCSSAWWYTAQLGVKLLDGERVFHHTVAVGASGAIMAIAGALLSSYLIQSRFSTGHQVSTNLDVAAQKSLFAVMLFTIATGIWMPGVDNAAHIGGVLIGFLLGSVIRVIITFTQGRWQLLFSITFPVVIAMLGVLLLQLSVDNSLVRQLRQSYDQQKASEIAKVLQEKEIVASIARKQAAEKQLVQAVRSRLPKPVSDSEARGKMTVFGQSGTSFALSADGKMAYAIDHYQNAINEIDLDKVSLLNTISGAQVKINVGCPDIFCGDPAAVDIAVLKRRPIALVSSMAPHAIAVVDLADRSIKTLISVGNAPNAILVSGDERRAYVHNTKDNSISVVDLTLAKEVHVFKLPSRSADLPLPLGQRLPMWLSEDGRRLRVALRMQAKQYLVSFDTITMQQLSLQELESHDNGTNVIDEVSEPIDSKANVVGLSVGGVRLIRDGAIEGIASWPICLHASPLHAAIYAPNGVPTLIAVADNRGYDRSDSLVHVADLKSGVIIGSYPVSGLAMKLQMSNDGSRVYVVTNNGHFVVLDVNKRMVPRVGDDLLCATTMQ